MRIGDVATLVRSKNAGPFMLTLDVLFDDGAAFDRVAASGVLSPDFVAALYGVPADVVRTYHLRDALTIKVSFPRRSPSGSFGDDDVYGCQYMARLAAQPLDAERAS